MLSISKRLKTIASLVTLQKKVIDIGTDHAYLPIYLYLNNITKNITASDISPQVLEISLNNLQKYNLEKKINLIKSDGFRNVDGIFDIAVITGMGTYTIINILNTKNIPDTLIIQSNNDYYLLRKHLNYLGYKIEKEIALYENKHYYIIIKFIKEKEFLTDEELLFGKSNNLQYYDYLKNKYIKLYEKSRDEKFLKYIDMLNSIIEKIPVEMKEHCCYSFFYWY